MHGSARAIFNKLVFGEEVKIRTPASDKELLSLRASLRAMKRKYNEGTGAALSGMVLKGEVVISTDPEDSTITIIRVATKPAKTTYEIL